MWLLSLGRSSGVFMGVKVHTQKCVGHTKHVIQHHGSHRCWLQEPPGTCAVYRVMASQIRASRWADWFSPVRGQSHKQECVVKNDERLLGDVVICPAKA